MEIDPAGTGSLPGAQPIPISLNN